MTAPTPPVSGRPRVLIDADEAIAACQRVKEHWATFHSVAPAAALGCVTALERLRASAEAAALVSAPAALGEARLPSLLIDVPDLIARLTESWQNAHLIVEALTERERKRAYGENLYDIACGMEKMCARCIVALRQLQGAAAAPARTGAPAEPREWLPIESAPRNGLNFLACSSASSVFLAHWANGVVDSASYSDDHGYLPRHATHFMPLPPPVGAAPTEPAAPQTPTANQVEGWTEAMEMRRRVDGPEAADAAPAAAKGVTK